MTDNYNRRLSREQLDEVIDYINRCYENWVTRKDAKEYTASVFRLKEQTVEKYMRQTYYDV